MFTRSISASSEMEAPIAAVWNVVLDMPRYGEWNPFITRVTALDGAIAVGCRTRLDVRWVSGGGVVAITEIMRIEPPAGDPARARYVHDFRGALATLRLLCSSRVQLLESTAQNRTRYTSTETFWGPLVWAIPAAKVRAGFEAHAQALKARVESMTPT